MLYLYGYLVEVDGYYYLYKNKEFSSFEEWSVFDSFKVSIGYPSGNIVGECVDNYVRVRGEKVIYDGYVAIDKILGIYDLEGMHERCTLEDELPVNFFSDEFEQSYLGYLIQ